MRIKSVSMKQDSAGRRYAWPANYFDFPDLAAAVACLRRVGFSVVRIQGQRAILKKYTGEIRYIYAF